MLWSEFLAETRVEIGDTGVTPRFSDAVLWSYTRDAVIDISRYSSLARRVDRVVLTVDPGNSRKFALPSDFLSEIFVECPLDTTLEPRLTQIGAKYHASKLSSYFVDRTNVYLNGDPSGDVVLTYLASHPYPASATTTTTTTAMDGGFEVTSTVVVPTVFTFTIPQKDIELMRLYVLGRVLKYMRVQQSKLDRFKVGGGARDDNPIFPETLDLEKTYDEALSERLPSGAVLLYRPEKRK